MSVEGLPADAEFFAEFADVGFLVPHGGHGQADLGRSHFERASAVSPSSACCGEARDGAFGDECSFEFGEGGEDAEDAEDEFPGCSCGVDCCALTGEDFQTDTPLGEVVDGVDEVAQIAAETVELPDQEGVVLSECFQAGGQVRPIILFTRSMVFVELLGFDSGGQERVPLQVPLTGHSI